MMYVFYTVNIGNYTKYTSWEERTAIMQSTRSKIQLFYTNATLGVF